MKAIPEPARSKPEDHYAYADRVVPENFCSSVEMAFRQVPPGALPQQAARGRLSYTIKDGRGARVEVQLNNRTFYIKSVAGGHAPDVKPAVSWAGFATLDDAWEHVKSLTQWASDA